MLLEPVDASPRGLPRTWAGGVDVFYPPGNEELQVAISAQGALISEKFMGKEP